MSRRSISGREFGRQMQVSDSYPSKLFAGVNRPEVDLLKRMALFLGADYEELAHLAGYRDRPSDASAFVGALRTMEEKLDERARDAILALAIFEVQAAPRHQQSTTDGTAQAAESDGTERVMAEIEVEVATEPDEISGERPAPAPQPRRPRQAGTSE